VRELLKAAVRGAALIAILPFFLSFQLKALLLGRNRALMGSSQTLAMVPGFLGQYLRRAFLSLTIAECHPTAVIEFGVLFSQAGARIRKNAYIGPYCQIGLACIESDALLAPAVHVPSGPMTHGTSDIHVPIREQPGIARVVTIGEGSWIGTGAVIMADIGKNSIVGAGSVVTKAIPDLAVAGGIPARVIKTRVDLKSGNPESTK
jgi:virginiamycin A acetyltransferase